MLSRTDQWANEAGGHDNITAILAHVHKLGDAPKVTENQSTEHDDTTEEILDIADEELIEIHETESLTDPGTRSKIREEN